MKVKELLDSLSQMFPLGDAESWDNPGLCVGDPNSEVKGVACALDVTPTNIRAAYESGCNVLVTHHPVYIEAPNPITPEISTSSLAGTCIWLAAKHEVSIISMHTNLDVSDSAMDLIADLLGTKRTGRLEEPHGYGSLFSYSSYNLQEIARTCAKAFQTQPIIWDSEAAIPYKEPHQNASSSVVFCSGSVGDCPQEAIQAQIRCIICGECGYHKALELNEAGIDVIILGHDASEKPFAELLADCINQVSPEICIKVLNEPRRWQALV